MAVSIPTPIVASIIAALAENFAGEGGAPNGALVDRAGNFILDRAGNYIVMATAPRTS